MVMQTRYETLVSVNTDIERRLIFEIDNLESHPRLSLLDMPNAFGGGADAKDTSSRE
jgi:hypothetical protein